MTVVDVDLLRALKPVWRDFGCAFCRRAVTADVESGFDVELAHLEGRGMGGGKRQDTVEGILGLCGGLTENRCHARFDQHEIELYRNHMGDTRWNVKRGGAIMVRGRPMMGGVVHRPRTLGREGSSTGGADPPPVGLVQPSLPSVNGTVPAINGPQESLLLARDLYRRSERDRVMVALLLLRAFERREYEELDMTWPEYYANVGMAKSEVSKMLRVAGTFRDMLMGLSDQDRAEVSLERLYLGARMVRELEMPHTEALHTSIVTPTHELVAQLKREPVAEKHECPECGQIHTKKED